MNKPIRVYKQYQDDKQYCVTVKLYVWAETAEDAAYFANEDLRYLAQTFDGYISGYSKPLPADAVEDTEV